jgi:hypothetical protein
MTIDNRREDLLESLGRHLLAEMLHVYNLVKELSSGAEIRYDIEIFLILVKLVYFDNVGMVL